MIRRLTHYISAHKWQFAGALILAVGTILAGVGLMSTSGYLISRAAQRPFIVDLFIVTAGVRFFGISRAVIRYFERVVSHDLTFKILLSMRTQLYNQIEAFSQKWLMSKRPGELLSSVTSDIETLQNVYIRVISPVIVAIVISILTFGGLAFYDISLAFVTLAFFIINGTVIPYLAVYLAKGRGKENVDTRTKMKVFLVDRLQGLQDLIWMGRKERAMAEFDEMQDKLNQIQHKNAGTSGLIEGLNNLMSHTAMFTVLVLSIPLVANGEIKGVMLAALTLGVLSSFEAFQGLANAFVQHEASEEAAGRLFSLAHEVPGIYADTHIDTCKVPTAITNADTHIGTYKGTTDITNADTHIGTYEGPTAGTHEGIFSGTSAGTSADTCDGTIDGTSAGTSAGTSSDTSAGTSVNTGCPSSGTPAGNYDSPTADTSVDTPIGSYNGTTLNTTADTTADTTANNSAGNYADPSAGNLKKNEPDTSLKIMEPAPRLTMKDQIATNMSLTFDDVSFYYDDKADVLRNISFSLPVGSKTAIVGPSGSGKSTLVNLLLGFWHPTQGKILADGDDIWELDLEEYRNLFGIVSQDAYIFNRSIRENLLLANPDAADRQLVEILQAVGLSSFAGNLDMEPGTQGMRFSGGERQLFAMARALLKNNSIWVFDEPTAHMDAHTERNLLNALWKARKKRTFLIITHRLIDMDKMDQIIVMDKGRIVEKGTHLDLLGRNGFYARMHDYQMQLIRD